MMKHITLLTLILISTAGLTAQGIEFFQGSWAEALAKAEEEQKIIFMDAYAEWCGPCKRMAATVFTDEKVGDFYNRSFINVKIDMEKGEGIALQRKYGVRAYPTLLFIDYDGEVVKKAVGAKQVNDFIQLGETALSSVDRSAQYAEQYEQGDRSPNLVYSYIRALNQAGKSSLKIANDYLRDQTNLSTPDNLKIIYEAATEIDSRIFQLMMEHRPAIEALYSPQEVKERILLAGNNTVQKAVEYNSDMLLEEAKDKIATYYPDLDHAFAAKAEMAIAQRRKDEAAFADALKYYRKKGAKQDLAPEVNQTAKDAMAAFPKNEDIIDNSARLFHAAAKAAQQSRYYLDYAKLLAFTGRMKDAEKAAQQALELAEQEDALAKAQAQKLLNMLQKDSQ